MGVNPYSTQVISGYNSNPPPDDGSQTDSNKVTWAKHKTKLGDPLKTLAENINSESLDAFERLALESWNTVTTTATLAESDWHTGLQMLATGRVIFPAPSSLERGWHTLVFNGATGPVPLQATATDAFRSLTGTVASECLLPPGQGAKVYNTATIFLAAGIASTATVNANDANTWTGVQTFKVTPIITSTATGSSVGPVLDLYRDNPSPTSNDSIPVISFNGNDSVGTKTTFADLRAAILDTTDGSEDGRFDIRTIVAGTLQNCMFFSGGMWTPNALNGDKGADSINASSYYENGVRKVGARAWVHFNGTGTPAIIDGFNVASITDHGPGEYTINFTNALADANYAVIGSCQASTVSSLAAVSYTSGTTSGARISVVQSGTGLIDSAHVFVAVF